MIIAISLIWSSALSSSSYLIPLGTLRVQMAIAENKSNATSVGGGGATPPAPTALTTTANQQINPNITSGNPVFIEHDKPTHVKVVFVNGTHGLQVSYSGRGVVKGINYSANGTAVIVPKTNGGANLSGSADILTADGEKGTYTFHAVGHIGFAKGPVPTKGNITHILANGPISDNGTAVFHSNSNGKLRTINGLVAAYKEKIDVLGRSTIEGWESK